MFSKHGVPRSRVEFLGTVPFFEGLPKKALARIDSHIDEVQVSAGRKLTEEGSGAYGCSSSPRAPLRSAWATRSSVRRRSES